MHCVPRHRSLLSLLLGSLLATGAVAANPGNAPRALAQVRDTAL